jgi:phosphoglycolate phosphatase
MLTANSAGMYAVGALWGFRTQQELLESGAKTIAKKTVGRPETAR